jgi:two-component system response regulator
MHEDQVILLVEDNPDDEALTLRALKKNNITNKVVVARDGVEAIDYLFGTGKYQGRDPANVPQIVLLRLLRADARTRLLPVIILTCSSEQRDLVQGYGLGANSFVRKPVDFDQFVDAVKQLGLYWLVLNEGPQGASLNAR